jgi:molybdenum cofactor cytidylyltransferase
METIPGLREGAAQGNGAGAGFWAIVLAAGAGSRFGGDKLRAPWGRGTLVEAAVTAARSAPAAGVILLTRPGDRLVDDPDLRIVEVADCAEGMAASLRAGVASLPPDAAGAFVFLGDMPRVPTAVLAGLADAVCAGAPAAAPTFGGELGHPVLFSAALFPELLALAGDRGARRVLDRLGDRLALIPAPDDGVLFDVDRTEDLARP